MISDLCKYGNFHKLKKIVTSRTNENNGALLVASRYGRLEIVKFFCENNFVSDFGIEESFINAVYFGHLDLVKYMSKFVNPKRVTNSIRSAILHEHIEIVKFLYNFGVPFAFYYDVENDEIAEYLLFRDYLDPDNKILTKIKKQVENIVSEYIGSDISSIIIDFYK